MSDDCSFTGTTSLTQTTSGIEPVLPARLQAQKKSKTRTIRMYTLTLLTRQATHSKNISYSIIPVTWMEATDTIRYSQEEIDELVAKSRYYKATSNDVDWLMKVKMQGRIQKWEDHSISVTINLPNDVDEILSTACM